MTHLIQDTFSTHEKAKPGVRGEGGAGPEVWVQRAQYIDLRGLKASAFKIAWLLTLSSLCSVGPYFLNLLGQLLGTSVSIPQHCCSKEIPTVDMEGSD